MYKVTLLFFWLVFFTFKTQIQAQHIQFQGKEFFLNGVNMPWNNFGWDFGEHDDWGIGYDSTYFENTFTELEAFGVNSVRMWIHCDGRANPDFDNDGFVTGLDNNMLDQLNDFVERANGHDLMVILTLWSHDMLENYTDEAGEFAGLHQDLILNQDKTQSYIDDALIPMVQSLNHHCNILAWEVFSEPEWCMKILGGGYTKQKVTAQEMQSFIGKCIIAIRQNSNHQITIGSAYPCGNDYDKNKNYWHETEFEQLGFDCNEVYVDFYSFHYFDWMKDKENVFEQNFDYWDVNKPIVIAETASNTTSNDELLTASEQLNHALEENYAGLMFWSVNAQDEYSSWEDFKSGLFDFKNENATIIDFENDCSQMVVNEPDLICSFYPNPATNSIFLEHHSNENQSILVNIYNTNGALVQQDKLSLFPNQEALELTIDNLMDGLYFMEIVQERNGNFFRIFNQKLVKVD
jgi:hypothetical protein